jgi:hypothetical protein
MVLYCTSYGKECKLNSSKIGGQGDRLGRRVIEVSLQGLRYFRIYGYFRNVFRQCKKVTAGGHKEMSPLLADQ